MTEQEYTTALKRIDQIFDAELGTLEYYELINLAVSIEEYELLHFPIIEGE